MDHLYELFGAPPLKCDQIFGLHRQAISLTKALESGKSIPPREVIPMIDMLQALLNIATAGYLYDIFPELESSDASHKSQRPRLPPAFEDLLKDLPFDLLVLRDQFFGSLMLPPLCKPHPQGATLCHHCNWVLERIGDKPSCKDSKVDPIMKLLADASIRPQSQLQRWPHSQVSPRARQLAGLSRTRSSSK